ncbi:MAG: M23 family metallopeptidase [Patescibacteria group bacterium]
MSTPNKLPESQNVPVSTPSEGGVSAASAAEGSRRESIVSRGDLDDQIRAGRTPEEVLAAAAGVDSGADVDDLVSEEGKEKVRGMFSGVSDFFSSISSKLGDVTKSLGKLLHDLFGVKDSAGGVDPDEDSDEDDDNDYDTDIVRDPKDTIYRLIDLLNPKAPFFTFLNGKAPRITSRYGNRDDPMSHGHTQNHKGIDLSLASGDQDVGEPIVATRPLKVAYTAVDKNGGNIVAVEDPDHPGLVVPLLHLQSLNNRVAGDAIQPGEVIAHVGKSGARVKGAHLHVEAKQNGQHIDPAPYLGIA